MSREYVVRALKLNPYALFRMNLELRLLAVLFFPSLVRKARQAKASFTPLKEHFYSLRIIPGEISGGPLANHIKRYDFARQFCAGKVVLDAACGVGYGSGYLADIANKVIGVDIGADAIAYAKGHYQKENIEFKTMDIHNLDFADKYFDVVCSFETLEHLSNPQKYLSEVKRVLKEGGVFIVSTPQAKRTVVKPKNPHHKVEFSQDDFRRLLEGYFVKVEIFGQRRLQSSAHYYLQKVDILHLRDRLPAFLRRRICHNLSTRSWDEAALEDFVISKEKMGRAAELLGVCYR